MSNPSELPAEFILQLKQELESDIRLLEELPGRIQQRKKRYEAALMFAPDGFDPDRLSVAVVEKKIESSFTEPEFALAVVENKQAEKLPSWTRAIQIVLDKSTAGLTHKDLLAKIRAEFPTMPISHGEKGFYNGVSKQSERKLLIKHGPHLYSSKTVDALTARGESLPDVPEIQSRAGSSGEIILSVLGDHPDGLLASDLKKLVNKIPDAPKSLREHSQYIYNVLATLIGTGKIMKVGNLYQLAEKGKAPVGTGASL